MAFCGKCGTQLNDGAKFCPKCGNPISVLQEKGEAPVNFSDSNIEEDVDESNEQENSGKKKWVQYALFIIGLLVFFYFYDMLHDGGSSVEPTTEQYQESSSVEQESVENDKASQFAERKEEVKQKGYKAGYENGFTVGPSTYVTQDPKRSAKTYYTTYYGAPMNEEEMTLCNIFVENYVKGYEEGHRNQ